jgi:hypothetical protein
LSAYSSLQVEQRRPPLLCFIRLYSQIQKVVEANWTGENAGKFTIVIDDVSLLGVAVHGSVNDVLDFLHYCATHKSEMVNDQT